MKAAEIQQKLQSRFGERITGGNLEAIDPWIECSASALPEVACHLKEDPELQFDSLNDLTVVDYFQPDEKKAAKFGHEPHLEVVYHLYSYTHKHHIVLKVKLPRWKDDRKGELPEVASVSDVWGIANWHEREAYDLMGVHFTGHPNQRRILCPEDWVGHPLRKDYEFPLEYHGVRGK